MHTMKNPEKQQDRAFDTYDLFNTYGYALFPQQRAMYNFMAKRCQGKSVLEAGCGAGIGSAVVERQAAYFVATDVSERNVKFAQELYPWINFKVWNAKDTAAYSFDIVYAIEMIEHVDGLGHVVANLLSCAKQELWLSSPNGRGKKRPPENPYHVCEYTPAEMVAAFPDIEIYHWKTQERLDPDTSIDPLLYRLPAQEPAV